MSTDAAGPGPASDSPPARRGFLNWVLGTWATGVLGSIVYPVVRFLAPPNIAESTVLNVNAGKATEFAPTSGKIVPFGAEPALILRTAQGELRAFAAECTHLSCTVQYRDDLQQIWCACHNGRYDVTGKNIAGPPPRPLSTLTVSVKDGDVIVSRSA